jgi:hypothetical protein
MKELSLIIKPDETESEVAEVLVKGTIDDRNYCFLLDTGAAKTTLLNDEYISKLKPLGKSSTQGVFSKIDEELIIVSKIQIGPIRKESFKLKRSMRNSHGARHLIGMDILKDYSYKFCFDENKVIINPKLYEADFQKLFVGKNHHPYIDISLQKSKAKAVWDTGAGITVVDLNFINANPKSFEETEPSIGTDATGAKKETPLFIMKTTKIANIEFPSHKVAGVDLSHVNSSTEIPMEMILGYSTFSKANWYFDFPNQKWAVLNRIE